MDIKLSILIPSVPERTTHLKRIVDELHQQAMDKPVEILVLLENKKRTTGSKRNTLIEQAKGEYVVFVDDDDRVTENYVDKILFALETNPGVDCVVFDVAVYSNTIYTKTTKYGKEFTHSEDNLHYYRKPNHLMCYAKRIAGKHKYMDTSYGEDDEWGGRASNDINHQARIPEVLYYYDYFYKPPEWYA